jgi:hypothetical protein
LGRRSAKSWLVRRSAGSGRRRAVTRALPLVAAGATPLRVAASTAATAAAVLGRPRLGRGDTVQGPALEVVKERVAAVGHAQEPGIEAGPLLPDFARRGRPIAWGGAEEIQREGAPASVPAGVGGGGEPARRQNERRNSAGIRNRLMAVDRTSPPITATARGR